jgi:hypothetical protein
MNKQKHSAYKSMRLSSMDLNKTENTGLKRWINEKWINLTALITDDKKLECGKKGKNQIKQNLPSVCRPSVKVNKDTPKILANNVSKSQIMKAIKMKKEGKRIIWGKL